MKRFCLAGVLAVVICGACSEKSPPRTDRPAVSVVVATAVQRDVPLELRAIGTVEAYSTVAIKSQVNGELKEIHFKEGSDVRKGDPLFSIDRRQFESDLRRAEANLARDTAQTKQAEANLARDLALEQNAAADARRYERLVSEGIVPREQSERMRASAESQAATVQADRAAIENSRESMRADRAAIENAKLQLDYCNIRSPIGGRTGNLIVHAGNLIKSNDTVLLNINQITPLYVSFAVPEQQLPEIKRRMAEGSLKVEVSAPGETLPRSQGTLTFVNNMVDTTTGTIRLKASFANEARRLWPGQFVDVVMTLATERNAVLVPSPAVQTGQAGTYVYLVRPDLTVETRQVVTGRNVGADAVIEKGLAAGDRVVTDGQLRLVPGARVEVKPAPEAGQGAHP